MFAQFCINEQQQYQRHRKYTERLCDKNGNYCRCRRSPSQIVFTYGEISVSIANCFSNVMFLLVFSLSLSLSLARLLTLFLARSLSSLHSLFLICFTMLRNCSVAVLRACVCVNVVCCVLFETLCKQIIK